MPKSAASWYQSFIINDFLMFLGPPSFFSLLEGATCGLTFGVTCKSLEATRATFLEVL